MTKPKKPEDKLPPSGGAPALYTDPAVMEAKIDDYFDSISIYTPIWVRRCDSGKYTAEELDNMTDDEKCELVCKTDREGNLITRHSWVVPPREGDLHRYLGMKHRDTWADYAKNPVFSDIIAGAKAIVEDWLKAEAAERNGNTTGVQFLLRCIYHYKDVQYAKVEVGGKLEDYFDE